MQWTSFPSRESRNTDSHLMLWKLEKSTSLMGHLPRTKTSPLVVYIVCITYVVCLIFVYIKGNFIFLIYGEVYFLYSSWLIRFMMHNNLQYNIIMYDSEYVKIHIFELQKK